MPPNTHPEDHPDTIWFWPWSKTDTRQFFASLNASEAFAPGPTDDKAIFKYLVRTKTDLSPLISHFFLNTLAEVAGLRRLNSKALNGVKVRPLQLADGQTASYMDIPVALLPKSVAAEFGADIDRLEQILPEAERKPGKRYAFEKTPDGYVLRPDRPLP